MSIWEHGVGHCNGLVFGELYFACIRPVKQGSSKICISWQRDFQGQYNNYCFQKYYFLKRKVIALDETNTFYMSSAFKPSGYLSASYHEHAGHNRRERIKHEVTSPLPPSKIHQNNTCRHCKFSSSRCPLIIMLYSCRHPVESYCHDTVGVTFLWHKLSVSKMIQWS